MSLAVFQVDAFSARPFRGNPAAVVPLERSREEAWMQAVALEMNLSETAFPLKQDAAWGLRWFTPAVEVPLCGHATLATAHVLWETGAVPRGEDILFDTKSGRLTARAREGWIELDFPVWPRREVDPPPGLPEALGAKPVYVARTERNFLVELDSDESVRSLRPDFTALARNDWAVIATARSARPEFDFVSRYFAPPYGIDEDPVTGSAHCALAPHWAKRLGRTELTGFQASARGGVVRVRHAGERVFLAGQAVTVLRGELTDEASDPVSG